MIYYLLGILTGVTFTGIFIFLVLARRPAIERTINQQLAKVKAHGTVLDPTDEADALNNWLDNLKHE